MPDSPEIFEEESNESIVRAKQLKEEKVSESDLFRLAKIILLTCAILYVISFIPYFIYDSANNKELYSAMDGFRQIVESILFLILGFYFGGKIKAKS